MRSPVAPAALLLAVLTASAFSQPAAPPAESRQPAPETIPQLIERMARDDFNGQDTSRRLAEMGPAAVPALIQATSHQAPRVRYWSIAALSAIGDERAVPAITRLLDDPDSLVRAVAVWHLGRWFDRPEVREKVLAKLRDEDAFVRGWALRLVQARNCREAVPSVRSLLRDKEPSVRYDALHTLAVMEGADALETLKKALQEDESPLVRECAVRCCTVLEPPTHRTAEVLISALRDKDESVRAVAAQLLRKGLGQDIAFDARADGAEREKAVRQWEAWYEAHKGELVWNEDKRRFEVSQPPRAGSPPGPPL